MPSFRPGAPSQAKASSATQFAPSQTRMHQSSPSVTLYAKTSSSNPFQASRSTFIHSYTQQHSSTPGAPHQSSSTTQNLGAHHNSSNSNPNLREKKRKWWSHQRLWRLLRMHPNTWKQSNMLGVNHLCMVQGNEESTSSFFPCLMNVTCFMYLWW